MNKYLEKIAALERTPLNLIKRLGQLQRGSKNRMIGRAAGVTDKKFPVKALGNSVKIQNTILNKVSDTIHL